MVTLNIKTNFSNVQRQLDAMRKDIATKALASALNKTVELGKTEMARQIAREYPLTVSKAKERLSTKRAIASMGRHSLFAVLIGGAKGGKRSVNLIRYQARETRKGLTAKQKKTAPRVVITGKGFIANSGRTAFRRLGKERLPIAPIQALDVPQMFNTRTINTNVREHMMRRFPDVIAREIAFFTRRFNGG
jgi:hypothetical protein